MEGTTSLEIQARLTKLSPRTRVIVVTGRKDLLSSRPRKRAVPLHFFAKPFNDEKFLTAIRRPLASELL